MSRVANNPVKLPKGVEVNQKDDVFSVKGSKGNLQLALNTAVQIEQDGDTLRVSARNGSRDAVALAGTFRSLVNNMVIGVSEGFQRKLQLQGVGYRAKAQGQVLSISVGFSHP
ncbi:MAG: 50S ribosomal protein L6, partial [Pseudomonas sp.]